MDLHFTQDVATDEEARVIADAVGSAETVEVAGRVVRGGATARGMRHQLLPTLAAVQSAFGWISPGALNEVCRRLMVPPAEAYGVATFYALLATEPQAQRIAHVCDDVACAPFGGTQLVDAMRAQHGPADTEHGTPTVASDPGRPGDSSDVAWRPSPCLGQCDRRPAVFVQRAGGDDTVVVDATADLVNAALVGDGPTAMPQPLVPQAAAERQLLARVGVVDPADLDDFVKHGGFASLHTAIDAGPAAIIDAVTAANLRGRGGAAFPTGRKWAAVAAADAGPRELICNADESEPGTFKDRVLLEGDPFALIEAMTIAGIAIGATCGYIYLRGEYPVAAARLAHAITTARDAGYLGANLRGSPYTFDLEIRRGQGAYICGEETALMESIEGFRGEPRNKPPFPTTHGLFGHPTVVNNVETLLNVPHILLQGPEAFAAVGTPESTGTRLFCLSGGVAQPGVYEVPFGTTLGELLARAGGPTDGIQAILLGGAAGSFVTADDLDLPLTFEDAAARGMALGSGVVAVYGDNIDMAGVVRRIAAFFRDETCGQCVPCRVGVVRQEEALARYIADRNDDDRQLLGDIDHVMTDASICGLGQTAASAVRSALRLGLV